MVDMSHGPPPPNAVLRALKSALPELALDFGVRSLALFGSVARNEATDASDVDILVEFDAPVGLIRFGQLQLRLEEIVGHRVDLVEPGALHPALKNAILAEARVAA